MFQDEQQEPIKIASTWKKERYVTESGCQTKPQATDEKASQSIKRKSKETQTEGAEALVPECQQEDSPQLLAWLQKIESSVHKELSHGNRTHAFDDYEVSWEEQTNVITNIHTLSHAVLAEELQVTGLSWNCTGSVIVASFGRFDHEDWCTHKSSLCTWNLDRRQLEATKPDTTIDLSSCLMCIQCHPNKPALVAGGTFNGEVMVWDLNKEEDALIASSGIGDDSHREPVSKVHWVPDGKTGGKYNIVSVSSDGKILIWKISSHKNTLRLVDGFVLQTDSLPRTMRARRGDQEMGVTCISLSKEDSTNFLIGSESGGIFKCSMQSTASAAGSAGNSTASVPLKSPVTFTFTPHHGPVYSVDCSPFHRNMFLSCGTDTSSRLYTMLQADPLITLEPDHGYLYGAKWSPARPLVFAIGTEQGSLLIYDLKHNRAAPRYKLETSDPKRMFPIYSVQFNPLRPELIATGDGKGYIRVWQLNDDLSRQATREVEQLEEIANASLE